MKLSKELKIGLLTVMSGLMLFFGFNYLKGVELSPTNNTYYSVYTNTQGLSPSCQVLLNGAPVGKVTAITLMPKWNNKILVAMSIDKDIKLNDSTLAILTKPDLLGSKVIDLDIRSGKAIGNKDTLVGTIAGEMMDKLTQAAKPIINKLDTTITSVNRIIDAENQKNIALTLDNLAKLSASLADQMKDLRPSLNHAGKDLEKLTASLVQTEKELKPLLVKISTLGDSLNKAPIAATVESANRTITQLSELSKNLNEGQGTLGKLMKDEAMYANLNKTISDLDSLFIDAKAHPKRYIHFSVFGKKDKK